MAFCTKCGASLPDHSHFCNACGAAVVNHDSKQQGPEYEAYSPVRPVQNYYSGYQHQRPYGSNGVYGRKPANRTLLRALAVLFSIGILLCVIGAAGTIYFNRGVDQIVKLEEQKGVKVTGTLKSKFEEALISAFRTDIRKFAKAYAYIDMVENNLSTSQYEETIKEINNASDELISLYESSLRDGLDEGRKQIGIRFYLFEIGAYRWTWFIIGGALIALSAVIWFAVGGRLSDIHGNTVLPVQILILFCIIAVFVCAFAFKIGENNYGLFLS